MSIKYIHLSVKFLPLAVNTPRLSSFRTLSLIKLVDLHCHYSYFYEAGECKTSFMTPFSNADVKTFWSSATDMSCCAIKM